MIRFLPNPMEYDHYKITSDTIEGTTFTIGYDSKYVDVCKSALQLSKIAPGKPFRVYRWSVKDRTYYQEAYYLNEE